MRLRAPVIILCALLKRLLQTMADMFTTPPAGTPVEPNNGVRYYYRRQIFPSTTADKENFEANREVSWRFSASAASWNCDGP